MGQILHGSTTMTEAVRRAIQHGQESLRVLAGPDQHQGDQKRQSGAPARETLLARAGDWTPSGRW